VRVIQYALTVTTDDGRTRTERYRLITTLTDWRACPAAELAACYARRWAIETGKPQCCHNRGWSALSLVPFRSGFILAA